MSGLKRILAATDLSSPARHAAQRAALIAKESGAALELLHVITLAPFEKLRRLVAEIPAELDRQLVDQARQEVGKLAAHILRGHGIAAGVHVATGSVLAELASQTGALQADLVVLGARGESFIRPLQIGSTSARMVSKTSRPMLVVKQSAHERYRRLLVPVDFTPYSLRALAAARAVAPGAEIVLLHAYEVPFEGKLRFAGVEDDVIHQYRVAARQEAVQNLQALRETAGLSADNSTLLVLLGDVSRHIIEQEQEQDCDLIVMGKHGESQIEDLLLGSVTKHVLAESTGDVLVAV